VIAAQDQSNPLSETDAICRVEVFDQKLSILMFTLQRQVQSFPLLESCSISSLTITGEKTHTSDMEPAKSIPALSESCRPRSRGELHTDIAYTPAYVWPDQHGIKM
jgi:hypothetical protein